MTKSLRRQSPLCGCHARVFTETRCKSRRAHGSSSNHNLAKFWDYYSLWTMSPAFIDDMQGRATEKGTWSALGLPRLSTRSVSWKMNGGVLAWCISLQPGSRGDWHMVWLFIQPEPRPGPNIHSPSLFHYTTWLQAPLTENVACFTSFSKAACVKTHTGLAHA